MRCGLHNLQLNTSSNYATHIIWALWNFIYLYVMKELFVYVMDKPLFKQRIYIIFYASPSSSKKGRKKINEGDFVSTQRKKNLRDIPSKNNLVNISSCFNKWLNRCFLSKQHKSFLVDLFSLSSFRSLSFLFRCFFALSVCIFFSWKKVNFGIEAFHKISSLVFN